MKERMNLVLVGRRVLLEVHEQRSSERLRSWLGERE